MVPKDPIILLSFVNTKLRDECDNLDIFCERYEVDKDYLVKTLGDIQYRYNPNTNQFN